MQPGFNEGGEDGERRESRSDGASGQGGTGPGLKSIERVGGIGEAMASRGAGMRGSAS